MLNASYSDILRELSELQACRHASLLTRSGTLVGLSADTEAALAPGAQALPRIVAALAASSRDLALRLDEEEPDYVLIRGLRQSTLVSEMPHHLLLVAVFPSAIEEDLARGAAEFVAGRLLKLGPVAATGTASQLRPEQQQTALRLLNDIFVQ